MARYFARRRRRRHDLDDGFDAGGHGGYGGFRPYVPVGVRRARGLLAMEKRRQQGHPVTPVVVKGRVIAETFWGKAWCQNLERYSDFANRLPRGRTYVRNGSVCDLQIAEGKVDAYVSGSELYRVTVSVSRVSAPTWRALCKDCLGSIDSMVELLQGKFAAGVMERLCRPKTGLFPSPEEIELDCSCPDWADMCKHVAAVLYGIGARLDRSPELLFRLRRVDGKDLLAEVAGTSLRAKKPASKRVLVGADLAGVFGVEMAAPASSAPAPSSPATPAGKRKTPARRKA